MLNESSRCKQRGIVLAEIEGQNPANTGPPPSALPGSCCWVGLGAHVLADQSILRPTETVASHANPAGFYLITSNLSLSYEYVNDW